MGKACAGRPGQVSRDAFDQKRSAVGKGVETERNEPPSAWPRDTLHRAAFCCAKNAAPAFDKAQWGGYNEGKNGEGEGRVGQTDGCIKIHIIRAAALFIGIFAAVLLFSQQDIPCLPLTAADGILDVRSTDFDTAVYTIEDGWAYYPMVLGATAAELEENITLTHESFIPYGTYRLELLARPKQYLMLAGYSLDYSTRLFINGEPVREAGRVADSAAEVEPRIAYLLIPLYTGETGRVEIVCQYANFVHKEGGDMGAFSLSSPENIQHLRESEERRDLVLSGGLCLFGLYFLLLAAMQLERQYAFLALVCVLMGLRNQNFFVVHLLPAEYDWAIAYRFLTWMIAMQLFALAMLLAEMYRQLVSTRALWLYTGCCAVLSVLYFVLPTQKIVDIAPVIYWLSAPFFLYLIACILREKELKFHAEDLLILVCYTLLLGADLYEAYFGRIIHAVTRGGTAPPWTLLFVMLMAVSVSIRANRQRTALAESLRQRDMLTQINQLKSDFLQQMAHELKTPLTVMSGYAQLTRWQLEQDAVEPTTDAHLGVISSEAQRLSALVSRLIEMADGQGHDTVMERVEVAALLADAAQICRPLLEKNGNRLLCSGGEGIALTGSHGMLLQVLINLTVNANRHTENGTVRYTAERGAARRVLLRVQDSGSGISEEAVPHIFERGYSTDGSSGIGLYICEDLAKFHGGSLTLERTGAEGSTFCLELPEREGE